MDIMPFLVKSASGWVFYKAAVWQFGRLLVGACEYPQVPRGSRGTQAIREPKKYLLVFLKQVLKYTHLAILLMTKWNVSWKK